MCSDAPLHKLRKIRSKRLALALELSKHALKNVVKHRLVAFSLAELFCEPMDLRLEILHLILAALTMLALSFTQLRTPALCIVSRDHLKKA